MRVLTPGLYGAKPRFQRALGGTADRLAAAGVHPDALTAAAVGCGIGAGAALAGAAQQPWLPLLVPPLVGARIALNALDGMVAQRRGIARAWGKVLNEAGDRIADLACLIGLALVPGADAGLVAAAGAAVLLSSHLGVLAEAAGGRRQHGGPMGKADRMLWLGLGSALAAATESPAPLLMLPWLWLGGALATFALRWEAARADLEPSR